MHPLPPLPPLPPPPSRYPPPLFPPPPPPLDADYYEYYDLPVHPEAGDGSTATHQLPAQSVPVAVDASDADKRLDAMRPSKSILQNIFCLPLN